MSLEILRATERSAPLDLRPDHAKRELSSWLSERRSELTAWEKAKAESALHELEKLIGSIRVRLDAKAGEPPPRPVMPRALYERLFFYAACHPTRAVREAKETILEL